MRNLIKILSAHPHRIFLIDAAGALLTSGLLFFLVLPWNAHFNLPEGTLSLLAFGAVIVSTFSFISYFLSAKSWPIFLRIVCAMNILYCTATASTIFMNRNRASDLAILYFSIEILIILALCFVELQLIRNSKLN